MLQACFPLTAGNLERLATLKAELASIGCATVITLNGQEVHLSVDGDPVALVRAEEVLGSNVDRAGAQRRTTHLKPR